MISAAMMLAFYVVLSDESRGARRYPLWVLPLLMAVWINCHGGALGGFVVFGAYFLAALMQRDKPACLRLMVQGALCAAAMLINPYGYDVFFGMWRTLGSEFSRHYIVEWHAFNAGNKAHSAMLGFIVLCLWLTPFTRRTIPLADRLLLLIWLAMAVMSIRHSIILGLLAMPTLALACTEWVKSTQKAAMLEAREEGYRHDLTQPGARSGVYMACLVWVLLVASPYPLERLLPGSAGFSPKHTPTGAMEYINAHYPNGRFYNDYNLGGYMIYYGRGRPKLFVDGRADTVYPLKLLLDYIKVSKHAALDPEGRKILKDYRIDGLILGKDFITLDLFTSNPEWKTVYKDDAAVVLVRSHPETTKK
jgi:hypothetical protein